MDKAQKAEVDELWETIKAAVSRLDSIADEVDDDEDPNAEPAPEGQVLANLAIAYSMQFIDDEGDLQFLTTYMVGPGVATESAVGLFRLAERAVIRDTDPSI